MKGVLRSVSTKPGEPSVMASGPQMMPMWLADNLALLLLVGRVHSSPHLHFMSYANFCRRKAFL